MRPGEAIAKMASSVSACDNTEIEIAKIACKLYLFRYSLSMSSNHNFM